LTNDAILGLLLIAFLVTGGAGPGLTYRRHRRLGPLAIHLVSAVVVVLFLFVWFVASLVWLGIAGLLAASLWNFFSPGRFLGMSHYGTGGLNSH